MMFGDFGHPRSGNKDDVSAAVADAGDLWMDHFVKGTGPAPTEGVTAYTLTCPNDAPSGGPYTSTNWATMAKGEIRFEDASPKTIAPDGGDDAVAAAFNPVGGGGACATASGADEPAPRPTGLTGSRRRLHADGRGDGDRRLHAPPGDTSQVGRAAGGRGPRRPGDAGLARPVAPGDGRPTKQVFQLHPNGWTFAEGHVPKLELLPDDSNPGRWAATGARRTTSSRSRFPTCSCGCR